MRLNSLRDSAHLLAALGVVENADDVGVSNESSAIRGSPALRTISSRRVRAQFEQHDFDDEQNDFSVETFLRVDRFQDGCQEREGKRRCEEYCSCGSGVNN